MRDLYIFGTGGLATEVAQVAFQINKVKPTWNFRGYIAAEADEVGRNLVYGPVIGTDEWILRLESDADAAIGIGSPVIRKAIADRFCSRANLAWPNLIHPLASVDSDVVRLGQGNIFTRNSVLTCDIQVGDFNYFNLCVTVGHCASLGSFNVINPGSNISGNAVLGDQILIGTGAQVLEAIEIASKTIVGAGAVVAASIAIEGGVYVGVPAKRRI